MDLRFDIFYSFWKILIRFIVQVFPPPIFYLSHFPFQDTIKDTLDHMTFVI